MPTNYDTLTRSESSSDSDERDERGGLSAQALHGTAAIHHAPLEHVVAPPAFEHPAPPMVRLPNLEGTLFDRSSEESEPEEPAKTSKSETEDDEDDEDDGKERPARNRKRAPVTQQPPVAPQPSAELLMSLVQTQESAQSEATSPEASPEVQAAAEQAEAIAMPMEQERSELEAAEQQVPHGSQPTAEQLQAASEYNSWSDESQPVIQQHVQPAAAHSQVVPQPSAHSSSEHADTPPPPPAAPGSGGQPPMPPINRPPESADFNNYAVPNMPVGNGYNYNQYDRASASPAPRQEVQPQYDNNRAVDGFARLMGVGNFIGNRRTRNRLGKQIEQNQRETTANFADVQAQQLRMGEQQRQQAKALEQLRQTAPSAERTPLPVAPFSPVEQAPTSAARTEYVPTPTYASQANPNMGPTRLTESRPMPPLPPIERPNEAKPAAAELTEQQMNTEEQAAQAAESRTVRSSWHEAVVDKHGKIIEGAKEYGQGFRQSRREVIRDRASDAASIATTAMAGIQQQQGNAPIVQYPGTLPSGMTSPTLPQGMPTHADPQHQLPPASKQSGAPGPIFWVMLAVIVAAFFAAALI